MSKVYVVMGSEDGLLEICTNVKAAYRVASEYVTGEHNGVINTLSYAKVCQELKEQGCCHAVTSDYANAEILKQETLSK